MKSFFLEKVRNRGGFKCYHAHFDKAFLVNEGNLKKSQASLQEKWKLYRELKENYTREDLLNRMIRCVNLMLDQDVTFCRTFVDADQLVGELPIDTALELRDIFKDRIKLEFAIQPLEGLDNRESEINFINACKKADIIGGLPDRDKDPSKHLDKIFRLSHDLDKPVDIHVGQNNIPRELEEQLVVQKVKQWNMQGKVNLVHAISLSCQTESYINNLSKMMADLEIGVIVCPSAAISMKQRHDVVAPIHNSIAPVMKLIENGVKVGLGIDNIADIFMPLVDGDLWFESRLLMEAIRCYDLDLIADIATCNL